MVIVVVSNLLGLLRDLLALKSNSCKSGPFTQTEKRSTCPPERKSTNQRKKAVQHVYNSLTNIPLINNQTALGIFLPP